MTTKTLVWVTDRFEAWHRWAAAPDDVSFLRDYHRHLFHVTLGMSVSHDDRDIEFFQLKRRLAVYLIDRWAGRWFEASCEMMAQDLLNKFIAEFCTVSEDGENGATVSRQGPPQLPGHPAAPEVVADDDRTVARGITRVVKTHCFLGIEAEGPNRGKRMLFVPGSVRLEEFVAAARSVGDAVWGVYLGAGNDRAVGRALYLAARELFAVEGITIEVESLRQLAGWPPPTQVMIVSLHPPDAMDPDCSFVKVFAGGSVYWLKGQGPVYATSLGDPLFAQDQDVEV